MRVLLIEDHHVSAQAMSMLLRHAGHAVFIAANAREALDLLNHHGVDLILSDIGLPDMNGLDLMRQIRRQHDIPAISISGFAGEDFGSQSRSAGFGAHLTKPIDFSALMETISQIAQRRPTASWYNPAAAAGESQFS